MAYDLENQLRQWIDGGICSGDVARQFLTRVKEGRLTRDENPVNHFDVFFAAYDPVMKHIFFGHHKKADIWLFNGGHIDAGESPEQTLEREIEEEWGMSMSSAEIGRPLLLTINHIDESAKYLCRTHYDIWYFVKLGEADFHPDQTKLDKEFHETRWVNVSDAKKLATDPNTLEGIEKIEGLWQ
jgi:8-oxo-dGTP pyrophosphatase MutT (NUDIX family)